MAQRTRPNLGPGRCSADRRPHSRATTVRRRDSFAVPPARLPGPQSGVRWCRQLDHTNFSVTSIYLRGKTFSGLSVPTRRVFRRLDDGSAAQDQLVAELDVTSRSAPNEATTKLSDEPTVERLAPKAARRAPERTSCGRPPARGGAIASSGIVDTLASQSPASRLDGRGRPRLRRSMPRRGAGARVRSRAR
jgi:hypothetical protein